VQASSFNLTVQSLNYDELYAWAPRLEQAIAELPEVEDVSNDMELKSPRVNLIVDRDGGRTWPPQKCQALEGRALRVA